MLISIPWRGHVKPLRAIGKQILTRNFEVSFVVPEEAHSWFDGDPGINVLSGGACVDVTRPAEFRPAELDVGNGIRALMSTLSSYHSCMYTQVYQTISSMTNRPGLLIIDRFAIAGIDVAKQLNIPYMINNPHLLLDIDLDAHPIDLSASFMYLDKYALTLIERCKNLFLKFRTRLESLSAYEELNRIRLSKFGLPPIRTASDLHGKQIILTNTVFGLEVPRPISPRIKMVGPLFVTKPGSADAKEKLPPKLRKWLDDKWKEGKKVVYTYLCDTINMNALNAQQVDVLLKGLTLNRDVRVLLSMPVEQRLRLLPEALPANVLWVSFLPQELVLAHKAVSVFVTNGSPANIHEGILSGKPLLVIPLWADQWEMGQRVHHSGAGIIIDKEKQCLWETDTVEKVRAHSERKSGLFSYATERSSSTDEKENPRMGRSTEAGSVPLYFGHGNASGEFEENATDDFIDDCNAKARRGALSTSTSNSTYAHITSLNATVSYIRVPPSICIVKVEQTFDRLRDWLVLDRHAGYDAFISASQRLRYTSALGRVAVVEGERATPPPADAAAVYELYRRVFSLKPLPGHGKSFEEERVITDEDDNAVSLTVAAVAGSLNRLLWNPSFAAKSASLSRLLVTGGGVKEAALVAQLTYVLGDSYTNLFVTHLNWTDRLLLLDVYLVYSIVLFAIAMCLRAVCKTLYANL